MDTCQINSIDQSNISNGYVLVTCDLTISSASYTEVFTVNETSPQAISVEVKNQAEQFKSQVQVAASLSVSSTATISSLVGTTIDL